MCHSLRLLCRRQQRVYSENINSCDYPAAKVLIQLPTFSVNRLAHETHINEVVTFYSKSYEGNLLEKPFLCYLKRQ